MDVSRLLSQASKELEPQKGSRDRVRAMMRKEIRAEQVLRETSRILKPSAELRDTVWLRVASSMRQPAADLLSRIGAWLRPTPVQLREVHSVVVSRLFQPKHTVLRYPAMRLAMAFAVFALLVRVSPLFFLAQRSSADSSVLLLPTRGTVEVSLQDLWQSITDSIQLSASTQVRTGDGEATVVLHDDGNVRLGADTYLLVRDTADRPEAPSLLGPSLTLLKGTIWVQGLVPNQLRGIVIATPQGDITVGEGSVSVTVHVSGEVEVAVWDRHVIVEHEDSTATLISGEQTKLTDAPAFIVLESSPAASRAEWVTQNLDRDAVHRREIAQLQQERRVADAGILPTSPLYPVKRIAERMDLMWTFDEENRVRKQLAFASTRLDEAAALIEQDAETDVTAPLEEYRIALLQVATGSGTDQLTQQLVSEQVQESMSDVATLSPTESTYLLKKAVLEASAALPDAQVLKSDIEGVILVDTLDALQTAAVDGDIAQVQQTFTDLEPYLKSIKEGKSELPAPTRKEAVALLEQFALTVAERDELTGDVNDAFLADASEYLPEPEVVVVAPLTEEEIAAIVAGMKARIYAYKLPRSRWNQLHTEFHSIEGHPDQGSILRALYHALPENGLAPYVRTEIQQLRQQQEQ